MMATVSETELAELLRELLDAAGCCDTDSDGCREGLNTVAIDEIDTDEVLAGCRLATFRERGLLTMNEGLVLQLSDGSEFQLTIVRSR